MIRTYVTFMILVCLVMSARRGDAQQTQRQEPPPEPSTLRAQLPPPGQALPPPQQELPPPKTKPRQYWPKPNWPDRQSTADHQPARFGQRPPRGGAARHMSREPYRLGNRIVIVPEMRPRPPLSSKPSPVDRTRYQSYRPAVYGYGLPGYGQTIPTGPSVPSYRSTTSR